MTARGVSESAAEIRAIWEKTQRSEHGRIGKDPSDLVRQVGEMLAAGAIRERLIGLLEITPEEFAKLADFEPFAVYGGWELALTSTTATEASIREVFEFVEGNCDLDWETRRDHTAERAGY